MKLTLIKCSYTLKHSFLNEKLLSKPYMVLSLCIGSHISMKVRGKGTEKDLRVSGQLVIDQ